jgi:hypothetical protein
MESNLTQPDLVQQRQQAHALLDVLSAEKLTAVRSLLEVMAEPLARSLALAPIEDEEISEEEERAVAEAREWLKHNKPIPHEEVLADFGLTMADFERMGQTPLPPEPSRSNH